MSAPTAGVPEGCTFERLFYNMPSNRLVVLLRGNTAPGYPGRLYTRTILEKTYSPIPVPDDALSVASGVVALTTPEMYFTAFRMTGAFGDWEAIYSVALEDLSVRRVIDRRDALVPGPFDDVAVLDLIDYLPESQTVHCRALLRRLTGSELSHCLCALNVRSGAVSIVTRLASPFF